MIGPLLLLASILVSTNSVTFSVSATGIDKGTPVEFFMAGKGTDRDYETMFLLDDSVGDLAAAINNAKIPSGKPIDARNCILWPVGVSVTITPSMADFIDSEPVEGVGHFPQFCYTGGKRLDNGNCEAAVEMPLAVLALFDCPQSLIQYNGIYPQGLVYSHHKCARQLKKGEKFQFTITWDGKTMVKHLDVELAHCQLEKALDRIKSVSAQSEIEVTVSFAHDVTVEEAIAFANALSSVDSKGIKINGHRSGDFFYRAFQPLIKWKDRKERLTQPFEIYLTIKEPNSPKVFFIEEDWSVSGIDPKLTEKQIAIEDMANFPQTDSCLFFVPKTMELKHLQSVLRKIPKTVVNSYVYGE